MQLTSILATVLAAAALVAAPRLPPERQLALLFTMSRVVFTPTPAAKVATNVSSRASLVSAGSSPVGLVTRLSSLQLGRRWTPSLAVWGAGAGVLALYVRTLLQLHMHIDPC